jgi:hypothetical protein
VGSFDKYLFKWNPALTGAVQGAALGSAPSVAQTYGQDLFDKAMRQVLGLVASQRNVPAAMGLRQGLQAQSGLQSQAANQAAMMRAQEMAQARGDAIGMQGQQQSGFLQAGQLQQQEDMFNKRRGDEWGQMILDALFSGAGNVATKLL